MESERRERAVYSSRAIQVAQEMVARWETAGSPSSDRLITAELRARKWLGSHERRQASELAFGYVRSLRKLHYLLDSMNLEKNPQNGVALLAKLAGVDQALGVSSETLNAAVSSLPGKDNPRDYIRICLSYSDTLTDTFLSLFPPDEAIEAAAAFNQRAHTTLRINVKKSSQPRLMKALENSEPGVWSPWALHLGERVNVFELPGYREAWFDVQEEASQLAVLLTGLYPGQEVIDVGAGAGGKTLALSAIMKNTGKIYAIDCNERKLQELKKRASNADVRCVEIVEVDAAPTGEWRPTKAVQHTLSKLQASADCVLLDAPCTGSGTLRRRPDGRYREENCHEEAALQQTLLAQAAPMVKPGGVLVYVTCAIEREQNEDVMDAFLATDFGKCFKVQHADEHLEETAIRAAKMADAPVPICDWNALSAGNYIRTWPHRHGMDGFFMARLLRDTEPLV